MGFDLRLPIGLLFTLVGLLLLVYGLFTPPSLYTRSLGVNVNLRWGLVLVLFGGSMLALALKARSRRR